VSLMMKVQEGVEPIIDPNIGTAVEFLEDVSKQKYWNEADLERYLLGKQGLTREQVQEAFEIHRRRKEQDDIKMLDEEINSNSQRTGPGERPEVRLDNPNQQTSIATRKKINKAADSNVLFLLPSRQKDGEQLIRAFLVCERGYCAVLESLQDDYQLQLMVHARQGTISLRDDEVEQMFGRIPKMIKFHKSFYTDMTMGLNIGRLFIRRLSFFKGYGDYIKDVSSTIAKLREHVYDKKLNKCLDSIRRLSRLYRNDLPDLLLAPLDRIIDYHVFLTKLTGWADKTQKVEYEFFEKASRRISRVAAYIGKYRHGLINRSEMNRVQQYLGQQCSIFQPHRSIIRRGLMIRRTTGWAARNKKYHFFLFNDVLLWTTKSGTLQNIITLRHALLFPSESKTNNERKFKIVVDLSAGKISTGKKSKTLLLECNSQRQKETWYTTLENAIKEAKNPNISPPVLNGLYDADMDGDSDEELIETIKNKTMKESDSFEKRMKIRRVSSEDWGVLPETSSDAALAVYHDRYDSHNFFDQKFQEFDPMDDAESQISDYDQSFFEKYGIITDEKRGLSPHQKSSRANFGDEKHSGLQQIQIKDGNVIKKSPKTCAIQRNSPLVSRSLSEPELDRLPSIERAPSFSLRLSDNRLTPDEDVVIRLDSLDVKEK